MFAIERRDFVLLSRIPRVFKTSYPFLYIDLAFLRLRRCLGRSRRDVVPLNRLSRRLKNFKSEKVRDFLFYFNDLFAIYTTCSTYCRFPQLYCQHNANVHRECRDPKIFRIFFESGKRVCNFTLNKREAKKSKHDPTDANPFCTNHRRPSWQPNIKAPPSQSPILTHDKRSSLSVTWAGSLG